MKRFSYFKSPPDNRLFRIDQSMYAVDFYNLFYYNWAPLNTEYNISCRDYNDCWIHIDGRPMWRSPDPYLTLFIFGSNKEYILIPISEEQVDKEISKFKMMESLIQ